MRSLTAAAVLLILSVHTNPASACSCISSGPPCQGYFQVDAVFAGAVTVISEIDGPPDLPYPRRLVRFAVERGFRGVDAATAEAVTGMGGGDCGYPFKTGERYLVYAYRNQEGRLATGICSRTRPLAEADEDLAFIQGLRTAPSGARVSGTIRYWERDLATTISLSDGEASWRQVAGGITTDQQGRFSFAVYEGLSYIARASYNIPDDPGHRQAQGTTPPVVISADPAPLRVVLRTPTR